MRTANYAQRVVRWLEQRVGTKRAAPYYYSALFWVAGRHGVACFNYGYAERSALSDIAANGTEPFQLEMYRQTALAAGVEAIRGANVLEISSGLGGGLDFIARRFSPRLCVGLEQAGVAVRSSRRRFGLVAVQGDATDLRLPDAAFDLVLNVEASHVYFGDEFLREAARVLKKGGRFVIADSRVMSPAGAEEYLSVNCARHGLKLTSFRDITANVALSCELDDPRREAMLAKMPAPLRSLLRTMLGGKTTSQYANLRDRRSTYFIAAAQKIA